MYYSASCDGAYRNVPGVVDVFPLKATVHEASEGVVGKPEVIETRLHGLVTRSLSAVSEAPTSEDLPFRCAVYGRFRYSDLKEAAPGELWGLYVDEPVLMVCEVSVAVGALRFQLVVAERMVVGRGIGESGSHNNIAF